MRAEFDPFARRLAAAAIGLVVVGIVVLILGAKIVGATVLGIAAVLGVSLLFYLVGRSEDRDRRGGL
jgi:hypothetical protein